MGETGFKSICHPTLDEVADLVVYHSLMLK